MLLWLGVCGLVSRVHLWSGLIELLLDCFQRTLLVMNQVNRVSYFITPSLFACLVQVAPDDFLTIGELCCIRA